MREMMLRLLVLSTLAVSVSGCAARVTPSARSDLRPASAIKLGEVLLRDDFDDPAAGRLARRSSLSDIEQGYLGGEYFLRLSASYKGTYRGEGPAGTFTNTHVAMEGRLVGGTEARWVGVSCRVTAKEGFLTGGYILGVFPATGQFALGREHPDRVCVPRATPILRGSPSWNRGESGGTDVRGIDHRRQYQRYRSGLGAGQHLRHWVRDDPCWSIRIDIGRGAVRQSGG